MWWLLIVAFVFGFLLGKWHERNWPGSWPRNGKPNGESESVQHRAAL